MAIDFNRGLPQSIQSRHLLARRSEDSSGAEHSAGRKQRRGLRQDCRLLRHRGGGEGDPVVGDHRRFSLRTAAAHHHRPRALENRILQAEKAGRSPPGREAEGEKRQQRGLRRTALKIFYITQILTKYFRIFLLLF